MNVEVIAKETPKVACHDCGLVHDIPHSSAEIRCGRCYAKLYDRSYGWLEKTLALTLTGLLLFLASNTLPFLHVELNGISYQTTLLSGVATMFSHEHFFLGVLVLGTTFIFPLLELLCLTFISVTYALRKVVVGRRFALSLLVALRPWSMLEILLLSLVIALVKMSDFFTFDPGPALFCFFGLVFSLVGANRYLNRHRIWQWISSSNMYYKKDNVRFSSCQHCEALIGGDVLSELGHCPRCKSKVHHRKPHSFQKAFAFTIAAIVLYIPANTYPILHSTSLGSTSSDTIFSGVVHLFESGLWLLALIVFIASILVPVIKIVTMLVLLYSVSKQSQAYVVQKTKIYRIIEVIGRWSMVDVFVVTLLVALVQFDFVATVDAGVAVIAFGGVVILSMLGTAAFDQRLLWDKR